MLKVACPPLTVAVPMVIAPSLNVTIPVGLPLPLVMPIVAVRSVAPPKMEGLTDEVRAVVVVALTTF